MILNILLAINSYCVLLTSLLISNFSEFYMHIEQKSGHNDDKPHNNFYPAGTDWRPTTEDCDFHLSIFHLHVEGNWEPDKHLPHLHRVSP